MYIAYAFIYILIACVGNRDHLSYLINIIHITYPLTWKSDLFVKYYLYDPTLEHEKVTKNMQVTVC